MEPTFIHNLIHLNRLDRFDFKRWLFYPGMLFCSSRSWWREGLPRPFAHEGIDLCFFEAKNGARYRFDDAIRVPMAETCRVVAVIDDFIGKTLVCEPSRNPPQASRPVYILYAHVAPKQGLSPGETVPAGESLARIAPADPEKTPLPPHLHVSVVFRDALPVLDTLGWPYLNRLDRGAFLDPAGMIGLAAQNMALMDFDPAGNIDDEFVPYAGTGAV